MSTLNNASRALQVMSKLQGWDPTTIDGAAFPGNAYPERRVVEGENLRFDGSEVSPQSQATPMNYQPGMSDAYGPLAWRRREADDVYGS